MYNKQGRELSFLCQKVVDGGECSGNVIYNVNILNIYCDLQVIINYVMSGVVKFKRVKIWIYDVMRRYGYSVA